MIIDLGLHIPRSKASLMKEFEPDDLEVRKRLYLSVYAWDKWVKIMAFECELGLRLMTNLQKIDQSLFRATAIPAEHAL